MSPPSFDFVIPLCPFERHLLERIQHNYSSVLNNALKDFQSLGGDTDPGIAQLPPSSDCSSSEESVPNRDDDSDVNAECLSLGETIGELRDTLFHGWRWYWDVQSLLTVVRGEKFYRDLTGTQTRADVDAVWEFKITGKIGAGNFRQKMLHEYNTSFFDRFIAEPLPRIIFIPAESDRLHWDILVAMAVAGQCTHLVNTIQDSDARFDIWKVVHQFTLSQRRPDNGQKVYEQFMLSAAFATQFVLEPVSDELGSDTEEDQFVILKRPEDDPDINFSDDEFTSTWAPKQLSDDPRGYVEIIPWEELEPTAMRDVEKASIDVFLPYPRHISKDDLPAMPRWMLWNIPSNHFFDSHLLHVDDEVYQYCILNKWYFPGHFIGNHVVFAVSPLEYTEFVANLRYFWDYWNDCALTVDPSNNQLYLLETIPGRQYRMRQKFHDYTIASRYFWNLVEDHARPTGSDARIRAILGSDYKSGYQNVLRYIPPEQLLHVDAESLGEGQNGAVYGAIWGRPDPILCEVKAQDAPFDGPGVPVVLKKVKPKSGNVNHVQKILRELDMTFTAVGGFHFGCVKFFGVTSFPIINNEFGGVTLSPHSSGGEEELFLVFERASEGNLFDFVERKLAGIAGTESWIFVLDTLSPIARGLANIHDHGIIHGDLHPKNILVNKIFYPNGPVEGSMEFDVLLSDFGEGKHLGDGDQQLKSTSGNFVCAVGDYMPKEVGEEGGWSAKADVYCFGRIAEMMLRIRVIVCTTEGSEDERAIPTTLKNILEKCLAEKVAERPQMSTIGQELDDLCSEIEDGMAEWATINTLNNKATGKYSSFSTSDLHFSGISSG